MLVGSDVGHAVLVVTDTLAAILGAAAETEVAAFADVAPHIGGDGGSTVLATGARTSPYAAALANGQAAVRLELDEGNQFAANHPSAHTLPAVLAVAEELDAGGSAFLVACVAAYEVAARVGRGTRLRRAVHPFGTTMACGAAVGVARLRGLASDTTVRAVQIAAALTPASTQRAANTGATVRNAITGVTAASGVLAVELAVTGTTADPRALHTVYGEVLGEAFDDRALDDGLGELRYLTRNYVKLHACSRWNHPPIEALAALVDEHGIRPNSVESVEVATYDHATRLDGTAPTGGFGGKHSIPYSVAARLLLGHNGIEAYTDEVAANPALHDLMARVRVVEDPALTHLAPAVRAARVAVRLHDGRTLIAQEDRAPGGFDRPYDRPTLRAKHDELLGRTLSGIAASGVLGWCEALPDAVSVRGLDRLVGRRA